jgi:hypothetical protein
MSTRKVMEDPPGWLAIHVLLALKVILRVPVARSSVVIIKYSIFWRKEGIHIYC